MKSGLSRAVGGHAGGRCQRLAFCRGEGLVVAADEAASPVTVAFFAEAAGWGDWYIGSVLVPPMPPGASVPVSVDWDTTGFSGEVPVKAVVNPYARTAETSTGNNSSSTTVTVSPAAVDFAQAMPANWNLISFPVEPESAALADVLSSIAGSHGLVYAYNGCDAGDPWRSYNPSAPPYVNDLSELSNAQGVWVQMNAGASLYLSGSAPGASSIPLCAGWNLVGFPALEAQPVADALASIEGCYSLVYAFDASDGGDPWRSYNPSAPPYVNDLSEMTPGLGYWIRAESNCTWTVGE